MDPEDVEMLQDLVLAAVNEALRNGDKALADYIERIRSRHELKQSGEDLRKLANRLKETKGYEG